MKKIFGFCNKYFSNHKLSLAMILLIIIISGLCTLAIPIISGNFIDYLVNANNKKDLFFYCFLFGGVSAISILIGFIFNRLYIRLNATISFEIVQDVIQHAQKISIFYFIDKNISKITQQISTDAKAIIDFCFDFFSKVIINFFQIVVPLIIIFSISKNMFIIIMILIVIYAISYMIFKKKLFKSNYDVKEKQNIYFSKLYEQLLLPLSQPDLCIA